MSELFLQCRSDYRLFEILLLGYRSNIVQVIAGDI